MNIKTTGRNKMDKEQKKLSIDFEDKKTKDFLVEIASQEKLTSFDVNEIKLAHNNLLADYLENIDLIKKHFEDIKELIDLKEENYLQLKNINQTILGTKTFSAIKSSQIALENDDLINKKYFDDNKNPLDLNTVIQTVINSNELQVLFRTKLTEFYEALKTDPLLNQTLSDIYEHIRIQNEKLEKNFQTELKQLKTIIETDLNNKLDTTIFNTEKQTLTDLIDTKANKTDLNNKLDTTTFNTEKQNLTDLINTKANKTDLNIKLDITTFNTEKTSLEAAINVKADNSKVELNKTEITRINNELNDRIDELKTIIDNTDLNTIQTEITSLNNKIDNNSTKINTNTNNITTNTNNINTNTNNINAVNTKINQLTNDLSNANIASYTGSWISSKNYKVGDIVNNNDNFYLAVKKNINVEPTINSGQIWKLLTFTVDTSSFVSTENVNTFIEQQNFNNNVVVKDSSIILNKADNTTYGSINVYNNNDVNIKSESGTIHLTPKVGEQVQVWADGLNLNGRRIANVATPSYSTDACNKSYVDSIVAPLKNIFYRNNVTFQNIEFFTDSATRTWKLWKTNFSLNLNKTYINSKYLNKKFTVICTFKHNDNYAGIIEIPYVKHGISVVERNNSYLLLLNTQDIYFSIPTNQANITRNWMMDLIAIPQD